MFEVLADRSWEHLGDGALPGAQGELPAQGQLHEHVVAPNQGPSGFLSVLSLSSPKVLVAIS